MPCSHSDGKCSQGSFRPKPLKELHGQEVKGTLHVFLNAGKEVSILLLLVWTILQEINIPLSHTIFTLATAAGGWVIWRGCKSAYLSWNQLDFLHRIILQEKSEIENNRDKEKEELKAMYRSKGLEGKLLDDVVDVFMSDDERLLKIMIEEEFGLTLETYDHPLKVGVNACMGAFVCAVILLFTAIYLPLVGFPILAFLLLGLTEGFSAFKAKRSIVSSAIWTMAIGAISVGLSHFLIIWIQASWLNL